MEYVPLYILYLAPFSLLPQSISEESLGLTEEELTILKAEHFKLLYMNSYETGDLFQKSDL